VLATVVPSFSEDGQFLLLDAPGMKQLAVPTAVDAYREEQQVRVESCGRSTTSGDGWSLGFIDGRSHAAASGGISQYLNREVEGGDGKRVSGFHHESSYAFVRNISGLELSTYPPILPVIERAKSEAYLSEVFANSSRQFADFAPVQVANQASAKWLGERCKRDDGQPFNDDYPIASFRSNIIVDGNEAQAWAEETWREIAFFRSSGEPTGLTMKKIKESARCTVPCRDQTTGGFIFPKQSIQLWKVYGKAFPKKAGDPDWGSWAGPLFGIYMSPCRQEGMLYVGDHVQVSASCRWDDHLRWQCNRTALLIGIGAATLATMAAWARARSQ